MTDKKNSKFYINLPGFGPLHIAAFIPVVLLAMTIIGVVVYTGVEVALMTPEEREASRARREEGERQEKQAEAERLLRERRADGYIDDPEIHRDAAEVIKSAGFSCPGVYGIRAEPDKGRGPVLRVQCKNNVFFSLTKIQGTDRFLVEIYD